MLARDQYSYVGLCGYKRKHGNLMKQTSDYILAGVRVSACAIDPLATCCSADPIKAPCKGVISIFFSGREDVRHMLIIDSRKYCGIQCPQYCEKISQWLHLASLWLRGGIGWRLSEGDDQAEGSESPGCALTRKSSTAYSRVPLITLELSEV